MSAAGMVVDLVPRLARVLEARARRLLSPDGKTRAAVLVPLLSVDGDVHVLYTRRAASLSHHQGQVAFPGGTHDSARDPSLLATALREAHEEIGLAPGDVRVLGTLDDIETMTSRFVITPVVAVAPHPYDWAPCPSEVDHIFTVPVTALLAPDAERRETWDFGGRAVPIDLFPVAGQVIWGATHRITRNLLDVIVEGVG
jgi:8-oxo-dGTP pyrophosphatase MutT (NUDIX family)